MSSAGRSRLANMWEAVVRRCRRFRYPLILNASRALKVKTKSRNHRIKLIIITF